MKLCNVLQERHTPDGLLCPLHNTYLEPSAGLPTVPVALYQHPLPRDSAHGRPWLVTLRIQGLSTQHRVEPHGLAARPRRCLEDGEIDRPTGEAFDLVHVEA